LTRKFLHAAALLSSLVLSSFAASGALAVDWTNGSALTGTPRLPQTFANFPYVNPQAPKGGTVRQGVVGSFDSFNDQIIKGEPAPFLSNIYQTLMTPSLDELDISSQYGLIAEATKYPDDFSSVSFLLNPKAKWHDGG
jgi:microcin C transport system substrate-binding protein